MVKVNADNTLQLLVNTNREESAANAEVSALFRDYYTDIKTVAAGGASALAKRRANLGCIARLVRALHVGHYFHDANGRLNTMVLLNRLLVDCGFPPVLMNRTDIFGGAFSEKELVRRDRGRLPGLRHPGATGPPRPRRPGGPAPVR